VSTSCLAELR
jgi:hypothetical protein